jgi:hypothetical protein
MRKNSTFLLILSFGIILKLLSIKNLPFDSDQAIVGLMGKHILQGAFPWLYYGDSYSGILEPLLASWSFLFLGMSRWSLHLIPSIFSILFILSIYQLGREFFNREIGLLSMLLAAVPPFSFSYYSSLAYGGYIETLWLGNILLLISHRLALRKEIPSFLSLFFLGLLWGVGWWTYPISVVYLISSFCLLLFFKMTLIRNGKILTAAFGFFLGSLPFWIWNITHQLSFLAFSQSREDPDFFLRINNFYNRFIEIFNASLKEAPSFISYLLAGLFLLSLLFLLVGRKEPGRNFRSSQGPLLLWVFFLTFCFFYVGSRFSEQNALRYFLPLYSILPITLAFLCYSLKRVNRYVYWGMTVILLLLNFYHQASLVQSNKYHSRRYQKQLQVEHSFVTFLSQKKVAFAYAPEYWSAAELTFNAQEHPVFTQPFHDRYPLYTLLADASSNPAFLLEGKHRQSFEAMFRAMGGTYKKVLFAPYQKVKGYVVYYDFEPPVFGCLEIQPDHWKGTSSTGSDSAARAFDRNFSSGWSSTSPQKPGMFFELDLGQVYSIQRIVFQAAKGSSWNFPSFYRIELSKQGRDWVELSSVKNNWACLFWSGGRPFWKLRDGRVENNFEPQETQFIKITLTGAAPQPWTLGEIFVYQPGHRDVPNPFSLGELTSFLTREKIEYVYADIGLSARITCQTQGAIKCLQDDYDITHGEGYPRRGYNGAFPYVNKLRKEVDFSLSPAFVVARENTPSFIRIMDRLKMTYAVKIFGDHVVYYAFSSSIPVPGNGNGKDFKSLYWTGTHLLPAG